VDGADPTADSGAATVGPGEGAAQSAEIGMDTAEYHERSGSWFFDHEQYPEAEKSYSEAIKT